MNDKPTTDAKTNVMTLEPKKATRAHRATYCRDKKKGGWIVRVEGPRAGEFAGRDVPVNMRDGSEHSEKLTTLLWTGADEESGKPVALYEFEPKPKEDAAPVEF